MFASGQERTLRRVEVMSVILPKADIRRHAYDVRFVPEADITATTQTERINR
jgi:hypothetical protein